MCLCTILEVFFIGWVIGIPLLMLLNPFYKGKTGKHIFHDDNFENGMRVAFWPFLIIGKTAKLMWNCIYRSWQDLSNYLEKLGKD